MASCSRFRRQMWCRSCTRQTVSRRSGGQVDWWSGNYARTWCVRKSPPTDSAAPSWPAGVVVASGATMHWRRKEGRDEMIRFFIQMKELIPFSQSIIQFDLRSWDRETKERLENPQEDGPSWSSWSYPHNITTCNDWNIGHLPIQI